MKNSKVDKTDKTSRSRSRSTKKSKSWNLSYLKKLYYINLNLNWIIIYLIIRMVLDISKGINSLSF
jgi:hypothetical protein